MGGKTVTSYWNIVGKTGVTRLTPKVTPLANTALEGQIRPIGPKSRRLLGLSGTAEQLPSSLAQRDLAQHELDPTLGPDRGRVHALAPEPFPLSRPSHEPAAPDPDDAARGEYTGKRLPQEILGDRRERHFGEHHVTNSTTKEGNRV